jgi:hypothetical protein
MIKRQNLKVVFEFVNADEVEDGADWTSTPEAVLRAKSELLADFLGCEVHDAERLLLDCITDIGV